MNKIIVICFFNPHHFPKMSALFLLIFASIKFRDFKKFTKSRARKQKIGNLFVIYLDELSIYKWTEPWNIKGRFPESWGLRTSVSSSSLPLPLPIFLLPLQLSRYNSTGNACYAGYPELFFRVSAAFSYVWSISFIYRFIRLPHFIKFGDMLYYVSKGNFSVVPTPHI